ncbi:hypothetical protein AAGS40_06625 [Paraburkholderia sp. PREW-6R]
MPIVLPANWLGWLLGSGLAFAFLWIISVPPMRERVGETLAE